MESERAKREAKNQELLKIIRENGKDSERAKNELLMLNKSLVAHVLKEDFANCRWMEYEEACEIGLIAVMKAMMKYDPNRGMKFSTFAAKYVKHDILWQYQKTKFPMRSAFKTVSFDAPEFTGDDIDGERFSLHNFIASPEDVTSKVEDADTLRTIKKLMKSELTEKEAKVVELYYLQEEPTPRNEIAKMLGVAKTHVSRIKDGALKKLKLCYERLDNLSEIKIAACCNFKAESRPKVKLVEDRCKV